jgi:hypothetical protein
MYLIRSRTAIVIATQKIVKSELEYQLIAAEKFWLVAPPGMLMPIESLISQSDLASLEQSRIDAGEITTRFIGL